MELYELNREQLKKLSMSDSYVAKVLLAEAELLPHELLGDIGTAQFTALVIKERHAEGEAAAKLGLAKNTPEHEDLHNSMLAAVEAVDVAFEAVLNMCEALNQILQHCMCPACQRRRGVKAAQEGLN